jgi:hypothetical protein
MLNHRIAAAVSAAIGLVAASGAFATAPNAAAAGAATHKVFVAGSSAAAAGFLNFVENQLCDQTIGFSQFNTPTTTANLPDFRAVSCTMKDSSVFPVSSTVTVWYRAEGGSAFGVLPVLNNVAIKQLDLASGAVGCVTATNTAFTGANVQWSCSGVGGQASAVGSSDGWTGAIQTKAIDIGVSDLEPGVFGNIHLGNAKVTPGGGNHDPAAVVGGTPTYSTAVTGTDKGVSVINGTLLPTALFQQVFGFAVNNSITVTDLPKSQLAAIFQGLVTDWSKVSTATNTKVTAASTHITVCNRETGSGTRAATDIFLGDTGCTNLGSTTALKNFNGVGQPADNLQTFAELDCVNTNANSIGYASIDNLSASKISATWPSIHALSIDGVAPSLTAGGIGSYGFVFEATAQENPVAPSADGDTFYQNVVASGTLQDVNTTSNSAQVLAIPGFGSNTAQVPLFTPGGTGTNKNVPVSDFTRGGNSCTPLTHG